jgi:beta-lactamase regulating signal transducer with metallopeptidase domain
MFTWLLYGSLCALPLVLLALASRRLRAAPALEHLLWVLVLARLVFPPLPELARLAGLGGTADSLTSAPAIVSSAEPSWGDVAVAWTTRRLGPNWSFTMQRWASRLFLAGVLFLIARELRRVLWVSRRLARARSAPAELAGHLRAVAARVGVRAPEVRVLAETASPFVWSLRAPVLVMPASDELPPPSVLAHELAHVERRDPWTAWLELVAGAFHFWNPLFWLARSRMHHAAELACDDWVVQRFPDERRAYAGALVEAAERHSLGLPVPRAVHAVGTDRRGFEARLRRILEERGTRRASRIALLAVAAAGLATLPGFAAPTLAAFRSALPELPDGIDLSAWRDQLARAEGRLVNFPGDGAAHMQRGIALVALGRFDEGIAAFERQIELDFQPEKAFYNQACAHARAGSPELALACLREARDLGLPLADYAALDPDLASLRELPEFERLLEGR